MESQEAILISTFDKLEERIKSKASDIKLSEADRYLKHYKFVFKRQNGSHKTYEGPNGQIIVIQGPIIKKYQIEQILNAIDSL
jgi:predicted RNA binding protein YcfA (HicA-like mRNA interferase family)